MVNVLDSRFVSERIFEGGTEIKELSGRRRLGRGPDLDRKRRVREKFQNISFMIF